jgi:hypothetical protein
VGSTQLYVTVDLGKARVDRIRVISDDLVNPRWYEEFHIYCTHFACNVVFSVKAAQASAPRSRRATRWRARGALVAAGDAA